MLSPLLEEKKIQNEKVFKKLSEIEDLRKLQDEMSGVRSAAAVSIVSDIENEMKEKAKVFNEIASVLYKNDKK